VLVAAIVGSSMAFIDGTVVNVALPAPMVPLTLFRSGNFTGANLLTFLLYGVLGLGMTITVAPLTTTVMNAVSADMAGIASGVNNAVSRTAALIAIAGFGMVMAWAFGASLNEKLGAMGVSSEVASFFADQRARLAGATLPPHLDAASVVMFKRAVGESFVTGFRWVMLLSAGLALISAASAWALIQGKARPAKARD
jgi:hypothetical protein